MASAPEEFVIEMLSAQDLNDEIASRTKKVFNGIFEDAMTGRYDPRNWYQESNPWVPYQQSRNEITQKPAPIYNLDLTDIEKRVIDFCKRKKHLLEYCKRDAELSLALTTESLSSALTAESEKEKRIKEVLDGIPGQTTDDTKGNYDYLKDNPPPELEPDRRGDVIGDIFHKKWSPTDHIKMVEENDGNS